MRIYLTLLALIGLNILRAQESSKALFISNSFASYTDVDKEVMPSKKGGSLWNALRYSWPQRHAYLPFKRPNKGHGVFIDFVGTGDIQKTISEGQDIQANTGIGIVYERVNDKEDRFFQSLELDAFINIFTTADTLIGGFTNSQLDNRRSFSSYLLNPISSRQSTYINANYYFGYPRKIESAVDIMEEKPKNFTWFGKMANYISGVNARFIASNSTWQYNSDTIRNIAALYARLGVFHEILPDNYRYDESTGRTKYSCYIGVNYSFRGMFGDLSSAENELIREKFLGSKRKAFGGTELNFGFRLNNLRAEFQMPILPGKGNKAIEGLTNTQFLFSIKFVGGFGLKLNSKEASGDRKKADNGQNS